MTGIQCRASCTTLVLRPSYTGNTAKKSADPVLQHALRWQFPASRPSFLVLLRALPVLLPANPSDMHDDGIFLLRSLAPHCILRS